MKIEATMLDEIQNQHLSYFEMYEESRKKRAVKTMSQLCKSIKQHHSVKYFEKCSKFCLVFLTTLQVGLKS